MLKTVCRLLSVRLAQRNRQAGCRMRMPPLSVLVLLAAASLVRAAEQLPGTTPPAPTEVAIPVTQIAEQAERTDSAVRAIRARLTPDPTIAQITRSLPATGAQIEQLDHDSAAQLAAGLTPPSLDDLRRQWSQIKDQLADWSQTVSARTQSVEEDLERLRELEEAWARTEAATHRKGFPDALREPIRTAQASIHETQTAANAQRDALLALLGRMSSMQTQVSEAFAQIDLAEQQMRRGLFTADAPVLWRAASDPSQGDTTAAAARAGLLRNQRLLSAFLHQQARPLVLHGMVLVVLLATTLSLSHRGRRSDVVDDMSPSVAAVLTRPISAALVLTLLFGAVLYPYAPVFVASLLGTLAIAPMMRLFRGPTAPQVRLAMLSLAVLLLISTLRRFLPPFVPLARLVLIAESFVSIMAIGVILRRARFAGMDLVGEWRRVIRAGVWSMLALLILSVAANLDGNVTLAILLTDGILGTAIAALAFLVASRILEALVTQIIASETAQRLRSVARYAKALRQRCIRIIHVLMVVLWGSITLKLFGLFSDTVTAVSDALAARWTIGQVSLSLADILTVVLTLWVSFFIARVIRVVLEQDVLPRMSLPRGVPAAISVGVNYAILLIGVVFALSAAGVDPARVTLIAGALGVGIGFGLQTIVNNFVSGLILLFERPIRIGDLISFGDVSGQVRRIGFRSCTIATPDGAEVVVPNGTLVSERVVNWTLSNSQRRIEVKVSIAPGHDPSTVIGTLEGAVKEVADLLEQPPPRAVLSALGQTSLEFTLWVWTDHQDMFAAVRSRVAVAVYDALRAAGIESPPPDGKQPAPTEERVRPPSRATDEQETR